MLFSGVVRFLVGNFLAVVLAGVVGVLFLWALQESREADDKLEAAQRTGAKARKWTGGLLGVAGAFVFAVLGTLFQTGMTLAQFSDLAADVIVMAPSMFAGFGVVLLGALGLEGVIPVSAVMFVLVGTVLFGLAALVKRRRDDSAVSDGGMFQ